MIQTLFAIFSFVFGTVVGSFLNVISLRYNTGMGILGRSSCFSCGKKLIWWELVPVASFLFLRGKCSKCGSKISPQYPLVEFLTGVLFLLVANNFQFSIFNFQYIFLGWTIWSILVVITVYDFRHKIIPDSLAYTFAFLSLAVQLSHVFSGGSFSWWNILAGPLLFLPFFILWFVSGGSWIGLGDGKLALGIGFLLGFSRGISAVMLAFWIGAAFSLILLGFNKIFKNRPTRDGLLSFIPRRLTIKSEIPFGPFLILGTAVVFFWNINVIDLHSLLNI